MIHEVYKPFEAANGKVLKSGDLVETSSWRNEQALLDQGKLGAIRKPQKELNKLAKAEGIKPADIASVVKKSKLLRVPPKPQKAT